MLVSQQITRVRRFLRDPNGRIWSDDFLLNLFNHIQEELQNGTNLIQEPTVIKVPPVYYWSYLYDWEYAYIPTTETGHFQALRQHQQAEQVYCFEWELQQIWQVTPDITSRGSMFTHPWEAWYLNPDDNIKIRFPLNMKDVIFIAYDKESLDFKEPRDLQENDNQYKTTMGKPVYYYRPDNLDNSFTLYPRPTVSNWSDGDGMALFNDQDQDLDDETGFSIRRTFSGFNNLAGIDLDLPLLDDNVFLVYSVQPKKVQLSDESPFPKFLRKYIEYGIISRAYRANTDGRIMSLAEFWEGRYQYGLNIIKNYMSKRRADRVYTLGSSKKFHRNKHPRLPSTYPNVNTV